MADDEERKEFDWDLHVNVPTIGVHRTLRVTSNESIGAVMIKLATKLGGYVSQSVMSHAGQGHHYIVHVSSLLSPPDPRARGRASGSDREITVV